MSESSRGRAIRIVRLATITAVAKGPGFLIPIIIASWFGAGARTDAYFLAYAAFLFAGGTIAPALEMGLVPQFSVWLAHGRHAADRELERWCRRSASWALGVALAAGVALAIYLRWTRAADTESTVAFFLLLAPATLAWCVAAVYSAALSASWRLELSAAANGLRGVGALAGAVIGIMTQELWPVALGISVGESCRVLVLRHAWRRERAPVGLFPPASATDSRQAVVHLAASQALTGSAPMLERMVIATLGVGAVSHLEYAARLVAVAATLFDGGLSPWLLVHWSKLRARHELDHDSPQVLRPILYGALTAAAIAAALIMLAPLLVRLLYYRGAFGIADAAVVIQLLRWYAAAFMITMTAACVERLLLARSQSRLFLTLGTVRVAIRLAALVSLVSAQGIVAAPLSLLLADGVYLAALVVASRRALRLAPA